MKHRSLIVDIDQELLPNTTYMFNFGDAVVDVTENNKAKDLVYVFSTGASIDSLSLSGTVVDAFLDIQAK